MSSPTTEAPTEPPTEPPRETTTGVNNADDGSFYAGASDITRRAEFRIGGRKGNILIVKDNETVPTEASSNFRCIDLCLMCSIVHYERCLPDRSSRFLFHC